jgi:predicted metal-dependent hydrolase
MQKTVYIESVGHNVVIARRKGTRSIRLAVRSDGVIKVSVPYSISEKQAIKFVEQKSEWILKHHKAPILLSPNTHIGKSHVLIFENDNIDKIKSRLLTNKILVKLPIDASWDSSESQQVARKACERALKKESATLLPQRLATISVKTGISYKSCNVKKLKSRWGSCDSHKNIVLNIYLIQLDWRLIDYVMYHELAHTKHQHHQADFWHYLESILPDAKVRRKELKQKPTDILPT